MDIKEILEEVRNGNMTAEEALLEIKEKPFEDIDFAKVDLHRKIRQGETEVIYGAGKTAGQIVSIVRVLRESGQNSVMITRLSPEKKEEIALETGIEYFPEARIGLCGKKKSPDAEGTILVITAGTSDIPVAEEAAVTAEILGNRVTRVYDAGVAGIHRLFSHLDDIMSASVIIAVAGMEGALASVVGGLAECPVIAVPTSVGYGAAFDGLAALLSMMNSCSAGVTAVNIDNGFGAGYTASIINHMGNKK